MYTGGLAPGFGPHGPVRERPLVPMIIVTGSTGFVGSYLVPLLARKTPPSQILCLIPGEGAVRAAGGRMDEQALIQRYRDLGVGIRPYPAQGSLQDYQDALRDLGPVDAVIYMAANNFQGAGFAPLREQNVEVLGRFIDALGPRLKGAAFIFTSSVMAAVAERLEPSLGSAKLERILPYGRSKQLAEGELLRRAEGYGYRPLVLRLGSVYGDRTATGLLKGVDGLMGLSLMAPIPYFPGRASIIHVTDVARLAVDLALRPRGSGVYLADDARPVAVGELVRLAAQKAGKRARLLRLPRPLLLPALWALRAGVRLGVGACLGLLALLDDVYVVDDTRVWSL